MVVMYHATNDFYKPAHPDAPDLVVYDFGPSLTRQEFADEADINVLMQRYERTGIPPFTPGVEPRYIDFTAIPDNLLDFMNFSHATEAEFMKLPATVRREFDNDPVAFCDYASDPANLEQMRTWGLAPPAELPDAPKEPEAPPAPPAATSAP